MARKWRQIKKLNRLRRALEAIRDDEAATSKDRMRAIMRLEKLETDRLAEQVLKNRESSNRFADLFDAPELASPPAKVEPAKVEEPHAPPESPKPQWDYFKLAHCAGCGNVAGSCATADKINWYCNSCRRAIESGKTIVPGREEQRLPHNNRV